MNSATTPSTCTGHNGSYSCQLTAEHKGLHQRKDYKRGSDNRVRMVVVSKWATPYSQVAQTRAWV